MRLFVSLSEYENEVDGVIATLNIGLPDGTTHQEVTEHFNRVLSSVYGYTIGNNNADSSSNS
jgi:hypothetical protein